MPSGAAPVSPASRSPARTDRRLAGARGPATLAGEPGHRHRWPGVIAEALRLQAITGGGGDLAHADGADLIVLAAPVKQNLDLLRRLPGVVSAEALVTDVGNTK